jgi:hypothetical protein
MFWRLDSVSVFMWNLLSWVHGPEADISIYWTQLSMFHLKTKIESSLRNVMF